MMRIAVYSMKDNLKRTLTSGLFKHGRKIKWPWLVNVLRSIVYGKDGRPRRFMKYVIGLRSFPEEKIMTKLDLTRSGLESVKFWTQRQDRNKAFAALRDYYRGVYYVTVKDKKNAYCNEWLPTADQIVNHIFQWGPYEKFNYGKQIDWDQDPWGDIEWVAAMHRFHWALYLADAYSISGNEKYAKAFVELTTDWIMKYPIELHRRGYAWLDIQTGTRAANLCKAFKVLIHSEAFTPKFLELFLTTLYNHQNKIETIPMGRIHNKAIIEQRGFVEIASTFKEFRDSRRWMELSLGRTIENLLAQTTDDGVQKEWCGGYHLCVLNDALQIMQSMESMEITVPSEYFDCLRRMYDYVFAIATPDLGFPMFGDSSRPTLKMHNYIFGSARASENAPIPADFNSSTVENEPRYRWPLYLLLIQASKVFKDSKFKALAEHDPQKLPEKTSYAFPEAGMYVLRDQWGPQQIYLALHCSPPSIPSSHDQPDNGTFELYAYGRWLMPDTGFYIYNDSSLERLWHRKTSVHQTLSVGDKNSAEAPGFKLWHTSSRFDAVLLENQSYPELMHRRTIWFVEKKFFVFFDEAIGSTEDGIKIHFQFAPGSVNTDLENKRVHTLFKDANVLLWANPTSNVVMEEEEGWFSWKYGAREPRKAYRFRHKKSASCTFLTLVIPYQGTAPPSNIAASIVHAKNETDNNRVSIVVEAFNGKWEIGRDILTKEIWCKDINSSITGQSYE